ncbi:two-component system phosphate regulon sensor histidine kinase PhoR [Pontibacter aydingkolensis]|uniref:histidine kinase n=1 Tax=Pontibacter aydingkolensis TaxID=1911536 RepID=A0ABS7CZL1_9BACT|nr:ATP-binding protein [Pontibacter aydingkolensis]MBW7469313.1 PAS domain-containing protein [Pontibacter aydingkolensis]
MSIPEPIKRNNQQLKELIELNEELENYFRNTIIPQLFVDANLILRKFTPPAMKQFSLSREHIGRPMEEMADNIRYSTIVDNILQVIKTGEIFEKEIQTTNMRWFQMNIIPYLVKKDNRTNGVIITFVDITDRMKVLRDLEKLNASHETFIYSVSHDLKAPLANIEGLVSLLIKSSYELSAKCEANNKEQKYIATLLDKSVNAMRTILNELSDIAKIEGNFKEIVETARFEDILRQVELTIKDKIVESNAVITYDIAEKEINFSLKNLRSILYNLLSNAVKYRVPGRDPVIHVTTGKDKGYVFLSVKDNGLGIADDKLEIIFTPYTRIERDVEGTGIGLYLVKKIVENEGGRIRVKSSVGEGSEFTVYLKQNALAPPAAQQ